MTIMSLFQFSINEKNRIIIIYSIKYMTAIFYLSNFIREIYIYIFLFRISHEYLKYLEKINACFFVILLSFYASHSFQTVLTTGINSLRIYHPTSNLYYANRHICHTHIFRLQMHVFRAIFTFTQPWFSEGTCIPS